MLRVVGGNDMLVEIMPKSCPAGSGTPLGLAPGASSVCSRLT